MVSLKLSNVSLCLKARNNGILDPFEISTEGYNQYVCRKAPRLRPECEENYYLRTEKVNKKLRASKSTRQ